MMITKQNDANDADALAVNLIAGCYALRGEVLHLGLC
jgi:hypothetical protein